MTSFVQVMNEVDLAFEVNRGSSDLEKICHRLGCLEGTYGADIVQQALILNHLVAVTRLQFVSRSEKQEASS